MLQTNLSCVYSFFFTVKMAIIYNAQEAREILMNEDFHYIVKLSLPAPYWHIQKLILILKIIFQAEKI